MDLEKTFMLREIAMQGGFVRDNLDSMLGAVRQSFTQRDPGDLQHGFMIGCGDSYFSALSAREFMMEATGLWMEPVESLEFSRYLVHSLPKNSVVLGISNSGTVSRTIEGVRLAREKSAWTLAVTVSEDNTLAKTAETLVKVNAVPNIKAQADGTRIVTPGTITYTASLLGLYVAAIALGERIGHLDANASQRLVEQVWGVAAAMSAVDADTAATAKDMASSFSRDRQFVIAGGGPNLGTAHFGAAKWLEALNLASHPNQIEEWAHIQYFMTDATVDTILIMPRGPSHQRGLEQARAAREMGSRVIIIGETDDGAARKAADLYFGMPGNIPETMTPFLYKCAIEYLACHVSIEQNHRFFGFDDPKREEINYRQIFQSAQTAAADAAKG